MQPRNDLTSAMMNEPEAWGPLLSRVAYHLWRQVLPDGVVRDPLQSGSRTTSFSGFCDIAVEGDHYNGTKIIFSGQFNDDRDGSQHDFVVRLPCKRTAYVVERQRDPTEMVEWKVDLFRMTEVWGIVLLKVDSGDAPLLFNLNDKTGSKFVELLWKELEATMNDPVGHDFDDSDPDNHQL